MLRTIAILSCLLAFPMVLMGSSCGGPVTEYDAGDKDGAIQAEAGECVTSADCKISDPSLFCTVECRDTACVQLLCVPRPTTFDASR